MKILLSTDMEGASWITDYQEICPAFPEYWQTGRQRFTADVVAAATGLLDGGATEIVVNDGHGFTWPNLIAEALPDRARREVPSSVPGDYDAVFQLGFHVRCGTPDGFLAHTIVPGFSIAIDGAPIPESHLSAFTRGGPLLGVVGDATLGRQLTGPLGGTPFLAVKRSTSKCDTIPVGADPAASAEAIRSFAERCAREWRERTPPVLPARFRLEFSMAPDLASTIAGQHGFALVSPAVLRLEASDWAATADARAAAIQAAARPFFDISGDLDLSSETAAATQPPDKVQRLRRYMTEFAISKDPAWRTA